MRKTMRRATSLRAGLVALAAALWAAAPADAYQIAEGLDLNGKFFADATVAENDDDSGLHLKRTYVILTARLQPDFSAHLTVDQRSEDDRLFVKYAFVEKTLSGDMTVRVGLGGTPYVPYDEKYFWGYRFVLQTFTDKWGMQTSSDLGASLLGGARDGAIGYQVSLLNGEGYQNTPDGNGFALAGRVNVDVEKAHIGAFFHEERDRNGTNRYNPSREGVFGFYEDAYVRIGGQVVLMDDGPAGNTGAGGAVFDSGKGYNVQGRVKLPAQREVWAFGRFDNVERNDGDRFLAIAGLSAEISKGLTVAPNLRLEDTGVSARGTELTVGVHAQLLL